MALERLSERVGVIRGGSNIGVVRGPGGVALIDTGLDGDSARRALRDVAESDWGGVRLIITTHGHADHFGGNAFAVRRTGAEVLAPPMDEAILRYPLLGPVIFYGGDPPATLRSKFLMARPSPVDGLLAPGEFDLLGLRATVVPLAGHSPQQMGVLVDGVFFCADVVLPMEAMQKHGIPYLFSLSDHLASLETAAAVQATTYVPGHGASINRSEFLQLVQANRTVLTEIRAAVLTACREPKSADGILTDVLRVMNTDPRDAGAYYLLQATLAAFLTALHREGLVEHTVTEQRALWQACDQTAI